MQMVGADFLVEGRAYWPPVSVRQPEGGHPPGQQAVIKIGETLACKEPDCQRRAHSLGWCTTHYRRWRSGQPMDASIRCYRRKRKRPFEAEYRLLAELGLRRN
jgi:hypothetical protein